MPSSKASPCVLLINPRWRQLTEPFEHLGLGYLAACLRQSGIRTIIWDMMLLGDDAGQIAAKVQEEQVVLMGVSITFQQSAKEVLTKIRQLKRLAQVPVAVGGIYPTFAAQELMSLYQEIDYIVKGEGEETLPELVHTLVAGGDVRKVPGLFGRSGSVVWETPDRPSVENLDTLPWPARDTLPQILEKTGCASILSSRGCYGRCTFCSVDAFFSRFGRKMRVRSAADVLAELEYLQKTYGVKNFAFNDAEFIGGKGRGRERAREIAEGILTRGWQIKFSIQCRVNDVEEELFALLRRAGLRKVFLGVESGSQAVLDRFQKDATVEENLKALKILSDLDIFVAMGFIMFDDRTSFGELAENMQFLQKVREITGKAYLAEVDPVSKVLPFAGTKIEARLKEEKRYRGNSLDFDYAIRDPKVEFVYRTLLVGTNFARKIKAKRGQSLYRQFDWETGEIKH